MFDFARYCLYIFKEKEQGEGRKGFHSETSWVDQLSICCKELDVNYTFVPIPSQPPHWAHQ